MKTQSPLQQARNAIAARCLLTADDDERAEEFFIGNIQYINDHKRDEHSLISLYADDETLDDATAQLEEMLDDIVSERSQESIQDKLDAGKLFQAYVQYRRTIDHQDSL